MAPTPIAANGDLSVGDVFSPQADLTHQSSKESDARGHENAYFNLDPIDAASREPWPRKEREPTLDMSAMTEKAQRRKKKKKQPVGGVAPALATVRGFTPMASGDEDSDFSTTSSNRGRSPQLAPAAGLAPHSSTGGVSALKLQLDSLSVSDNRSGSGLRSATPSNASYCSDSDQTEVLTSYEVPLENDFVSSDAAADESSKAKETPTIPTEELRTQLRRKMTADDFEPILCLGKGAYGTVLLVRHKMTGKLYAQKQFRKASMTVHRRMVEQTKTERMILESISRHPFVVKLFYAFQDHEKLYLILEYAQGGELFTHLAMERMFSEDTAVFYMAEMVLALEHLHQNVGVIYRDLKPENCLLDKEGHLLLTDFGLSKIAIDDDQRCSSSLGTFDYMAPEVIQGKPYGKACDWWSLGALGYDLLTGSPPFKANNNAKLQEKILKQKLTLPYFLTPDAKDLLTRLLRKEPSKRLGYHMPRDLQTIKKHRFFRKIDWKALERRELDAPIKPVITDPALAENFSVDFTQLQLSPAVSSGFAGAGAGAGVDGTGVDVGAGGNHEAGGKWYNGLGIGAGEGNGDGNGNAADGASASTRAMPMSEGAANGGGVESDPFGGFSFVASNSLLDHGLGDLTSPH